MGFYPQNENDEMLFSNFKDVVDKYRYMLQDGLIIFPPNGIYPRLRITNNRGIRAGKELLQYLCRNLIDNPPITMLQDIRNAEFVYYEAYDMLGSLKPVTFLVLQNKIPAYKLNARPTTPTPELPDIK